MSRLGILAGSLRSLLWSSPDRPAVSLVLTAMLRQAQLPYWSGRGSEGTRGIGGTFYGYHAG